MRTTAKLIALTAVAALNACAVLHNNPAPSPAVAFDFAGLTTSDHVGEVQALRATITWTISPRVVNDYPVSTWIAFAGSNQDGTVSYRIAQVGWIESRQGVSSVFWEWDNSKSDSHQKIGPSVSAGTPLKLEIDRGSDGSFTFSANDKQLATEIVSWDPTDIGIFAETHNPVEYLPGSSTEPETVTRFEEQIGGAWIPYVGEVLNTSTHFRVDATHPGALNIWDDRQTH